MWVWGFLFFFFCCCLSDDYTGHKLNTRSEPLNYPWNYSHWWEILNCPWMCVCVCVCCNRPMTHPECVPASHQVPAAPLNWNNEQSDPAKSFEDITEKRGEQPWKKKPKKRQICCKCLPRRKSADRSSISIIHYFHPNTDRGVTCCTWGSWLIDCDDA